MEQEQPPRAGARPGRWGLVFGVVLCLAAVVLGGRVADDALSVPGPPVQVAEAVSVRPLSGWRPVRQGPGVLLTRGSGNLAVLPAAAGADPAALAGAYARQVLAPIRPGPQPVAGPAHRAAGVRAGRGALRLPGHLPRPGAGHAGSG